MDIEYCCVCIWALIDHLYQCSQNRLFSNGYVPIAATLFMPRQHTKVVVGEGVEVAQMLLTGRWSSDNTGWQYLVLEAIDSLSHSVHQSLMAQ